MASSIEKIKEVSQLLIHFKKFEMISKDVTSQNMSR